MKTITHFNQHTQYILEEMCKRVNVDCKEINFDNPNWFGEHEWTELEENNFKYFLIGYLYINNKARKELMNFPSTKKSMLEKWANDFMFFCGWKLKEE